MAWLSTQGLGFRVGLGLAPILALKHSHIPMFFSIPPSPANKRCGLVLRWRLRKMPGVLGIPYHSNFKVAPPRS